MEKSQVNKTKYLTYNLRSDHLNTSRTLPISARRSFCTNMYLLGVPVMTIMAISGNRTEKSFRSYIKESGEEHARIMNGFWDKQNKQTQNDKNS